MSLIVPFPVVNRPGWASGKAMVAFLDGKTDVNKAFNIDSYEGNTAEAVEIDFDYTAGAAALPPKAIQLNQAVERASLF